MYPVSPTNSKTHTTPLVRTIQGVGEQEGEGRERGGSSP